MTGRYERPPAEDNDQEPTPPDWRDGPPTRTRTVRALFVLVVMIVLGVLILPAATRGPRLPTTAATNATHPKTITTPTTVPKSTTTTTIPTVAASTISVLVANGQLTPTGASLVKTFLTQKGFNTAAYPPYNATKTVSADAVYFVNHGTAPMADQVAKALSLTDAVVQPAGTTPPVSTTQGADIVVVLGADLATRASAGTLGSPPPASTTS